MAVSNEIDWEAPPEDDSWIALPRESPAAELATEAEPSRERGTMSRATKERWGEVLDQHAAAAEKALLEAIEATKHDWGYCPKCKGKVEVRHPDVRARTDAVKTLVELAGRRPKQEEATQADLVVQRHLVPPSA